MKRAPILALLVVQLLDVASTAAVICAGGQEGSPVAAAILRWGGMGSLLGLKVAGVAAVAWALSRAPHRASWVWCAAAVYAGVVVWNLSLLGGARA